MGLEDDFRDVGQNSNTPTGQQIPTTPDDTNYGTPPTFDATPTTTVEDADAASSQGAGALNSEFEDFPGGSINMDPNVSEEYKSQQLGGAGGLGSGIAPAPGDSNGDWDIDPGSTSPSAGSNGSWDLNPQVSPRKSDALESLFNKYRVKLVSTLPSNPFGLLSKTVEFKVTPEFSENRTVDYTSLVPLHMPGSIEVYKSTNSRTFSITAKLVSRTRAEATMNIVDLQVLRSWTMPFFGINSSTLEQSVAEGRVNQKLQEENPSGNFDFQTQAQEGKTERLSSQQRNARAISQIKGRKDSLGSKLFTNNKIEMLGAPPEVLYLYAYSADDSVENQTGDRSIAPVNIQRVPVVMISLAITYPSDVEYILTYSEQPFPVIMNVAIELKETHSPSEYSRFSLLDFKLGTLRHF